MPDIELTLLTYFSLRWLANPERINFMKNLPGHELSRRRLQQSKAKSLPAAPAPHEAQQAQEEADGHSSSSEAED